MTSNQQKVRDFHEKFLMPVADKPQLLSNNRFILREKLIDEEVSETFEAFDERDLAHIAKELADILYVVYGTAVELGINLDEVFDEVHRSNMSKLDRDSKPIFRDDGKVMKGPDYFEPDIWRLL